MKVYSITGFVFVFVNFPRLIENKLKLSFSLCFKYRLRKLTLLVKFICAGRKSKCSQARSFQYLRTTKYSVANLRGKGVLFDISFVSYNFFNLQQQPFLLSEISRYGLKKILWRSLAPTNDQYRPTSRFELC